MPSEKKKIRVLIVEDSAVVRHLLELIIGGDERLEVAASLASAEQALQILPELHPDIISMDINLPGMDGLEATHQIMTTQPTPILIVSSSVSDAEATTSLEALRAGAVTVAEKPVGPGHPQFAAHAAQLCNKLVIMSEVRVVRQRQGRYLRAGTPPIQRLAASTDDFSTPRLSIATDYQIVGVVASTGGPQALVRLFSDLGTDFPLPVLLVQHITAAFVDSFSRWLGTVTGWQVVIGEKGVVPTPGCIYVAPADRHLCVEKKLSQPHLRLSDSPLVSGQRPSGTELFASMANVYGAHAIGVLLTGMGDDGADGLLNLRTAGGYTIAEDQSTAVVYGMPAAAVNRGAARESLPLPQIGSRIQSLLRIPSEGKVDL